MTTRALIPALILALALPAPAALAQQADTGAAPAAEAPAEPFVADGAPGSFGYELGARLYGQSLAAGLAYAEARLAAAPDDQTAMMAIGFGRFAAAVQGLAQDLQRHGLSAPGFGMLPFFRLPVPENATPEPLDYQGARQILIRFVGRLAEAEAALAGVTDPAVELPLRPAMIRFDLNGDGIYAEDERFAAIFGAYTRRRGDPEGRVDFDASDAPWLMGYTHLLSAMAEFWLAHDWHEGFEATFQMLFPDAGLPMAILNELPRQRIAEAGGGRGGWDPDSVTGSLAEDAQAADAIAFFHLIHWPVAEPARLAAVRTHLKAMIATSRESWRRIRAETDDAREWIPGPGQSFASGENRPAAVTEQTVAAWLDFLDRFEAILDGKLLLPHWRLTQGINLRRVLEQPRTFDVMLWIQGAAAVPYLEDGPIAGRETWEPIMQLMGGDFWVYFVWFN